MYEKDYFIWGTKSNYQDYTKKKYGDLCEELIKLCWIRKNSKILDFWCALWNLVMEFVDRWYKNIEWTDISQYALEFCIQRWLHKEIKPYNTNILSKNHHFVFMLDVLEHIKEDETRRLLKKTVWKIIFRFPVSNIDDGRYVLDISENDKTHIIRKTKKWWTELFDECWYNVKVLNGKHIYDSEWVFAGILLKKPIKWR